MPFVHGKKNVVYAYFLVKANVFMRYGCTTDTSVFQANEWVSLWIVIVTIA